MTLSDLAEFEEVRSWLEKSGYSGLPQAEQDVLLDDLRAFCEYTRMDPGEMVASCLAKNADGLTKISIKGRRQMQAAIDSFVQIRGLEGREGIVVGNRIRGFLIHNGVFIQGRAAVD
jgi:hypothetical protein